MNNPLPAADEPLLIISGLPSSEPTPAWVQAWSSAGVAQWVPPQALLGPRGAALADSHARIVWLYRAPWGSVGPAGMRLGSWLSLQRQALRQRGQNPGAWVLVNADLLDPEALADHLGLWVDAPVGDSAASAQSIEAEQQQLLWARLFEWAAPQAWDMYEALEAATWAAPGQPAPMLREELPAPEPAAVEALQRKLQEAEEHQAQAQRWQARAIELEAAEQALLQEAERELEQTQEDLAIVTAQRDQALAAAQAARQEADRQLEEARTQASSQIAQVQDALEHVKAALEQAHQELSARTAESEQARAEAARQLADAQALTSQRETQLKEAQEEGELLLLQLHQVQEELEQLFLQGKEKEAAAAQATASAQASAEAAQGAAAQAQAAAAEAQAAASQAEIERHQARQDLRVRTAERDQARQDLGVRLSERDQARQELDVRTSERDHTRQDLAHCTTERDQARESLQQSQASAQQLQAALQQAQGALDQSQGALLLAQSAAHQSQAALENTRLELNARTVERDQARQDLSVRTAERDQARDSLQAARAQAAQQQAESQAAAAQREAQLKESQEEGELLLLQLHQVQEELETHFLRGKDLEQQLQSVRARYQRLQSRYPQAVDVDAVEVEKTDPSAEVPFVAWRLKGLSVGGTVWPELVLHTSLESAGAGVRLEAPAASAIARGMDGPLVPKALTARDAAQMERFRGIGQQAWEVLIAACAAVDEVLGAPASAVPGAPADFDPTFWRQSLGALAPVLRGLPPVFRHDGVRLKREKVNPDYEHLWLVFEGAAFGAQPMPGFEMRLGAAQTQLAGFSHLPKLEFPLGANGKPPFEGWFEESRDDFGPKFELRADLNRQAFDLAVWARVPKAAQSVLLSLIADLPAVLDRLEQQQTRLSRPWSDWKELTRRLIEVLRVRLAAPRATPLPTMPPEPTLVPADPAMLTGTTNTPSEASTLTPPGKPKSPGRKKSSTSDKRAPRKTAMTNRS